MTVERRNHVAQSRIPAAARAQVKLFFLASGDVAKGRVEPIMWMQMCNEYALLGLQVKLVTLRVHRRDGIAKDAIWDHYGLPPRFRIATLPTTLSADSAPWRFQISAGLASLLLALTVMPKCLFRRRPVVIHARSPVLLLPFAVLRRVLPRARRPSLVMEIHALTGPRTARIIRSADIVVVTSSKLARDVELLLGARRDRILEVPLGPHNDVRDRPKAEAREILGLPSDLPLAAYVGKLTDDICDFLLQTALALARNSDPVRLMLVGGNPLVYGRTKTKIEGRSLEDVVMLAGFVAPAKVPLYEAAADVLLFHVPDTVSSFEYCTPAKGFEYQAAARPIVATDIPLFEEVFGEDGERAIRVRERTPEAFAAGIAQALALEDGGQAMTKRASGWVKERTWKRRTQAIIEALGL
jgi:glycosyltransferase involved in cell wall biosynthesis